MSTTDPTTSSTRGHRVRHHPEPAEDCAEVRGWPLLGVVPRLMRDGLLQMLDSEWRRLGDAFRVRLGPRPCVVVTHPDAFERVLAGHQRRYVKGSAYDATRLFMGDGLVTLDGERWKSRRRLMQPYFHRAALRTMIDTMSEVIDDYFEDLRRRHPEGGRIDVHQEMVRLTIDVVCTALFGPGVTRSDEISYETIADAVAVMGAKSHSIVPTWVPTALNRRFRRVRADIDETIYRLIERARSMRDDPEVRSTLLGMLLEATDEDGRPLSDEVIRNEAVTLYLAGHETTALAMTWLFALQQGRSEHFERLREEVDGLELRGRRPGYEDLGRLVHARRMLDETLRLRPPATVLARDAIEDDNLCGVRVRKGDMVFLFFWGLHRHPDYWTDPERFDPERFVPEVAAERDSWSYLPFSGGPRVCIGEAFSLSEGQLILAAMASKATWEVEDDGPIVPVAVGTIRPHRPVLARFRWR